MARFRLLTMEDYDSYCLPDDVLMHLLDERDGLLPRQQPPTGAPLSSSLSFPPCAAIAIATQERGSLSMQGHDPFRPSAPVSHPSIRPERRVDERITPGAPVAQLVSNSRPLQRRCQASAEPASPAVERGFVPPPLRVRPGVNATRPVANPSRFVSDAAECGSGGGGDIDDDLDELAELEHREVHDSAGFIDDTSQGSPPSHGIYQRALASTHCAPVSGLASQMDSQLAHLRRSGRTAATPVGGWVDSPRSADSATDSANSFVVSDGAPISHSGSMSDPTSSHRSRNNPAEAQTDDALDGHGMAGSAMGACFCDALSRPPAAVGTGSVRRPLHAIHPSNDSSIEDGSPPKRRRLSRLSRGPR